MSSAELMVPRAGRAVGDEKRIGVDRRTAIGVELEVGVDGGGVPRRAGEGDDLPRIDVARLVPDDSKEVHVDVGVAVVTREEERQAAATPESGLEGPGNDGDVLRAAGRQHVNALVTPACSPAVAPLEGAVEGADEITREGQPGPT